MSQICPYCAKKVKGGAIKCPYCQSMLHDDAAKKVIQDKLEERRIKNKKGAKVAWIFLGTVILIIIIVSIISANSSTTTPTPSEQTKQTEDQAVRDHFKGVQSDSPELTSITCDTDKCNTGIVYFNYKKVPDDLEFVIKGNTVTYSNLVAKSSDYNTTGKVFIFAKYKNKTIYTCQGESGVVIACTNQDIQAK